MRERLKRIMHERERNRGGAVGILDCNQADRTATSSESMMNPASCISKLPRIHPTVLGTIMKRLGCDAIRWCISVVIIGFTAAPVRDVGNQISKISGDNYSKGGRLKISRSIIVET